jgi:DNA-binding transcriptional MerR regulator
MKMRDLESRTGVNRETIRIFLRHGLVPEPSRPKHNVADYDESHVRAVLAVRDLQRNSTLTLRQIRESLQGELGERRVEASAFQHLEALVATRVGIDVQPILISSLSRAFPDAPADARHLAAIGAIEVLKSPKGPALSVTDARLVTIWSEMRQGGFTEELGFTPDILTFYLQPAEMIAEREATLFLERTEGRIDDETAAAMLQLGLRLMLDFFGLLRMKRFLQHIHKEDAAAAKAKPRARRTRQRADPST